VDGPAACRAWNSPQLSKEYARGTLVTVKLRPRSSLLKRLGILRSRWAKQGGGCNWGLDQSMVVHILERMVGRTQLGLSYLLWPGLMAAAIGTNAFGMQTAHPILWFNVSYFGLALVLFLLERVMPHERDWLANDGQMLADLGHTVLSKTAVQIL